MAPPLLLRAAITIVVRERLVNSIIIFHFVGSGSVVVAAQWQRWQRRQHGSRAAVANLSAEVTLWRKRGFYFVGSGSVEVAAWRQRWRQRQHGGGGQLGGKDGSLAEA